MPSRFIAGGLLFLYDFGMEKLLETLEQIGVEPATIDATRRTWRVP